MIYIGADHRGFELKEKIKAKIKIHNYQFEDLGAFEFDPEDDYTDIAIKVAKKVAEIVNNMGILLCGSGAGVAIAANKVKRIRAFSADNPKILENARKDDEINILCLPADFIDENLAWELIEIFLNTEFVSSENHLRRIKKIDDYENR
jgi:ribose 5-phosphate isomerase B